MNNVRVLVFSILELLGQLKCCLYIKRINFTFKILKNFNTKALRYVLYLKHCTLLNFSCYWEQIFERKCIIYILCFHKKYVLHEKMISTKLHGFKKYIFLFINVNVSNNLRPISLFYVKCYTFYVRIWNSKKLILLLKKTVLYV